MFRIGEFSKITMTAITQLRYYDQIGLFQPEYTDQLTGYRYYSMAQVPKLHRILALKELGLSLDQIQRLVANEISVEEIRGMLVLKKAQVEQDVRAEIMRLRNIEIHLQQITDDDKVPQDGISLKRLPTTAFLGSRRIFSKLSDGAAYIIETSQRIPRRLPKTLLGHFTVLFHGDAFDVENADIELGFSLNEAVSTPARFDHDYELATSLLPEVASAACALHVGPLDTIIETYAKVGRWIELNHYTLAGPVREVFITPPQPDARNETVCEIQIPVEAKQPKRLEPHAY
jgi:DNA-binding transcriptional MerR regulator/effector-binding domain-containing protein